MTSTWLLSLLGEIAPMAKLSGERLRKVNLPLPSLPEQSALIQRMTRLSATVYEIESRLTFEAERPERLPTVIFRRAFAGDP